MILQEIFSLAGKCGFFKESGTNSLDEHKLENLFILKDILINKDTEDWDKTIFSNFLNKEIEAYRLYNNDDKKRIAIMKLLLMLNLNDLEYANSLNKKINFKYSILIHELNITGYDNQKAIVLCHASELLLFVVNYFIKKLSDYNLVLLDTLDICLPFFQNIMIYIREKFKSNESNGVIEVNLSNMIDIASNNPYRLNEFDLSSIKYEVIE